MVSEKIVKDLCLTSMKHFDNIRTWCSNQKHLYFIFVLILMIPNAFLFYTEQMALFTRVAFIALPLSVYMAIMLINRKPGVMIWVLFPMLIFGAFQLVLLNLFGQSIIAVDMFLNLCTTNSGEALELLDKLIPAIVGVCLLYIPTLVLGVHSIRSADILSSTFRKKTLKYAVYIFLSGCIFSGMARWQAPEYRVQLDIFPVNIFYNIKLATQSFQKSNKYKETSKDFTFNAASSHDPEQREIYVMVVGETGRALNWGIYGYDKNTTPYLQQKKGLVHFTDMITQSNATHKSVPMILSNASAENFECIYHQKSVISAFKEAGFRTAFFSNQLPNRSFIDFFAEEADIHEFLKVDSTKSSNPYDMELVKLVRREIARNDKKLFIILHTYGSHFNYQERYPASEAHFKPDNVENVNYKIRDRLLNAYDNTIRYTDRFLHELTEVLSSSETASGLLYSADHGEDIFDDNRRKFLHASPIPTYYQLHVPAILWLSDKYNLLYPESFMQAKKNSSKPITTNILFHTMLSVGGIETPVRNDSLVISSNGFKVVPRCYLNDHNRPKKLNKLGLKKQDIDMFKKEQLAFP